jgi:hypothetical protein
MQVCISDRAGSLAVGLEKEAREDPSQGQAGKTEG